MEIIKQLLYSLLSIEVTTMDEKINSVFKPISDATSAIIFYNYNFEGYDIPIIVVWLITGAIISSIFLNFINIRGVKHALDVVRGKYDDPKNKGEVSHFQALTAALSGTVGVGNIAGVAVAISIGGPGATFWIILAGFFGMAAKFTECTLGVKYRTEKEDGTVSGGPMYYLSRGLKKEKYGNLGKFLAAMFAIFCIGASFAGGNMVQINQATSQLISVTGGTESILYGNGWIFGVVMAIIIFLIIVGGIKSIAKVTDKVVPFMVGVYILGAMVVFIYHFDQIPRAFMDIIEGAFTKNASFGGFIGVLILGFRRAAFSNEAGIGSASIAHSAAKTDEPVSEGIVALLEPFIDTVVVCTITALVIIITGNAPQETTTISGSTAIGLTSSSFESVMPWFPKVLSIAVILFALSTMISWSYYGQKAWGYLFGERRDIIVTYKIIFCLFAVLGSAISAQSVFDMGDAMIFAMSFPNVIGIYLLLSEVKVDLRKYMNKIKTGQIKKYK